MGYRDLINQTITEILGSFDDSVSIKIIEDQQGQSVGYDIIDSFDKKGVIYTFVYTMSRANKEPIDIEFKLEFKVWGEVVLIGWNRESHNHSSRLIERFKSLYSVARKQMEDDFKAKNKQKKLKEKSEKELVMFPVKARNFDDYAFKINDFLCSRFIDFPTDNYNEMVKNLSVSDPQIYKELIEHLDYMDSLSDQLMSECEARIDFKDKQSEKVA